LVHNFGVDQHHFFAKFGTVMENRQPKGKGGFNGEAKGAMPAKMLSHAK